MSAPTGRPAPRSGVTADRAELVGTYRPLDRAACHPADDAAGLWAAGGWRHARPAGTAAPAEVSRAAVASLVDDLLEAGATPDARAFLTTFDVLVERLAHFGVDPLLADFAHASPFVDGQGWADVRMVHQALLTAEPILRVLPSQLPEQLLARLPAGAHGRTDRIRERATTARRAGAWLRPLSATLAGTTTGPSRVLELHGGLPSTVAFSPDGSLLAAADDDVVVLWSTVSQAAVGKLTGHSGPLRCMAVTGPGPLVVAGTQGGELLHWSLGDGGEPQRLPVHRRPIMAMAVIAGGLIATGASDGTFCVTDLATGAVRAVATFDRPVAAVAMLGDARRCVVASCGLMDPTTDVSLWDLSRRRLVRRASWRAGEVTGLAVTRGDRDLLVTADKTLYQCDPNAWKRLEQVGTHAWRIRRVLAAPDGRDIITADAGGHVLVWDLDAPGRPQELRGHRLLVADAAISSAGILATAGHDRTVRIWALRPKPHRRAGGPVAHRDAVQAIAAGGSDRRPMAVTASRDGTLILWEVGTATPVRQWEAHDSPASGVCAVPERGWVASVGWDGRVAFWRTADGSLEREFRVQGGSHLEAVAIDTSGRTAVTLTFGGVVTVWDVARGVALHAAKPLNRATAVAITADGRTAVAVGTGVATLSIDQRRAPGSAEPSFVVTQPDGREMPGGGVGDDDVSPVLNCVAVVAGTERCLIGRSDGVVLLYDWNAARLHARWQVGVSGLAGIDVTPDGRLGVTAAGLPTSTSDDTVRVWDCAGGGRPLAAFTGDCPMGCCRIIDVAGEPRVIAGDAWGRVHFFTLTPARSDETFENPPLHRDRIGRGGVENAVQPVLIRGFSKAPIPIDSTRRPALLRSATTVEWRFWAKNEGGESLCPSYSRWPLRIETSSSGKSG